MEVALQMFSHYGFVFSLGLLSGFTPCSMPTIMLIATYSINIKNSVGEKLKTIIWLVMGMMTTLLALTIVFSYIGRAFLSTQHAYILTSLISVIMGLSLMGLIKLPINPRLSMVPTQKNPRLISFFLGAPFTILGSPCSLPVLFTLLSYVATQGSVANGLPFMLSYGIGRAVPIFVITILGSSARKIFESKFATSKLNYILGIKLLTIGIYLLYQVIF